MAGKGGGAWKVAYADFVTAMMAFFMVMWLTSQKPEAKEALESYFRDPWAQTHMNSAENRKPTIFETKAGATDPGKKFMGSNPMLEPHSEPESLDAKKPKITTVRATDRTATGTVINFEEGTFELSEDGKRKLRDLMPKIEGLTHKLEIRAHSSMREQYFAGDTSSNWEGCYRRSLSVLNYLVELGIDPQRLRLCQAGGYEPRSRDKQKEFIKSNVRVEVFMLSETVESFQGTHEDRTKLTAK